MDFIKLKSGHSINPAAISLIDFTKPDAVTIQVGSSSVTADGEDADALRKEFGHDDAKGEQKKHTPEAPLRAHEAAAAPTKK